MTSTIASLAGSTALSIATRTTVHLLSTAGVLAETATKTETSFVNAASFATDSTAMLSYLRSMTAATPTQALAADDPPPIETSATDPYLEVLPAFMYSLPVQIICIGTTITLLGVLLVHLLFTIRYHWPLSKLNYSLQTTSVAVWTVIIAYQLGFVFRHLWVITRSWPFVFDYIEVSVPPEEWASWQLGIWYTVQAASNLLVHATHIQFLTLLFPSGLEKKLILSFLGPLALISSFLYYTSLASSAAVQDLGDAIRNTANSSLTLLYTLALFIWGIFLNRKRAWQTDGGTAAFGFMSLFLGICSTSVNFYEVSEDRMRWLPGLIACGLLWQSWVGFWWWVGAGMWTGEASDIERRERKKARRAEKKRLKAARKQQSQKRQNGTATVDPSGQAATSSSAAPASGSFSSRFLRRRRTNATQTDQHEAFELQAMNGHAGQPEDHGQAQHHGVSSQQGDSMSSSSLANASHYPALLAPLYRLVRPWLSHLREAHDAAALERAAEPPAIPDSVRRSWGLQALMVRGRRERDANTARSSLRPNNFTTDHSDSVDGHATTTDTTAVIDSPNPRQASNSAAQNRRAVERANARVAQDDTYVLTQSSSGPGAASQALSAPDDREARRAEFLVDGGQRLHDDLEDDEEDDFDVDEEDDGEDYQNHDDGDEGQQQSTSQPAPPAQGRTQGRARARRPGQSPNDEEASPPVWRRAVNKWRLKDVSTFQ